VYDRDEVSDPGAQGKFASCNARRDPLGARKEIRDSAVVPDPELLPVRELSNPEDAESVVRYSMMLVIGSDDMCLARLTQGTRMFAGHRRRQVRSQIYSCSNCTYIMSYLQEVTRYPLIASTLGQEVAGLPFSPSASACMSGQAPPHGDIKETQ
jgi:hypothetical protein